jgi:CubicO group peptidase (beta-lactamase class C family)
VNETLLRSATNEAAIAVMQLWEQGLVDHDAPASDYLCSFRLIPAKAASAPLDALAAVLTAT